MKSGIDFAILANWVSMLRSEIDGAILLSNDAGEGRFYEKCVHPLSRVVPSPGVACQLLADVKRRGIGGLIATVCASDKKDDCDNGDIFCPGLGDVASLLLASSTCERALEEITGSPWFRSAEKDVGSLRDRAISIAWIFQQMLASSGLHSGIFSIEDFVDWSCFDLSGPTAVANFGRQAEERIQLLRLKVQGISLEQKLMECEGINAIRVLACATKMFHPRGLAANQVMDGELFMQMLRVAYDFADFEHDTIYWRMRRWERANPKFPLLRAWRVLDPLQVVLDQRYWEDDLRRMISIDSDGEGMSAIKMDLDNFKAVNEQLGHTAGDEAIRLYCRIVRDTLRHTAEVYRRGGDEVVALAPGVRQQVAADLAEKIRIEIETEFLRWGGERGLLKSPTVSIGIVDIEPGCTYERIILFLDMAQSRAKADGKNRAVLMYCKA